MVILQHTVSVFVPFVDCFWHLIKCLDPKAVKRDIINNRTDVNTGDRGEIM